MPKTGFDKVEFEEKVLDESEKLICRYGADRFVLSDTAKKLRVSHAALYKYFKNKETVLDLISKRWLDRIDLELSEITKKRSPVKHQIINWFIALHNLKREKVLKQPELYRVFEISVAKGRPFIEVHLKTAMKQLIELIKHGIQSGELDIKIKANEAAVVLFEATAAYHYPKLVHENINKNRTSELIKLLKILMKGMENNH